MAADMAWHPRIIGISELKHVLEEQSDVVLSSSHESLYFA